jgi:cytochrome c oxidase subunit IV
VVAGVIMRRWITFCEIAPCTGMSGSSFGLSSRLRIVLFVFVICWLFVSGVISECVFHFCLSGVMSMSMLVSMSVSMPVL